MSKEMSEALEAAAQQSEIITRMLMVIYAKGQTIRLAANADKDVVMPDGTVYTAADIKRGDISTNTDGDKEQVQITLSNKWNEWAAYFANNGTKLKGCVCEIKDVFLDHLEEDPVWRFKGILDKPGMTVSEFTWTITRDIVDYEQEEPSIDYGPTCQWAFGSERCGYKGTNGPCDQTLSSCDSLGNILNFQGHPSIPLEMVLRT